MDIIERQTVLDLPIERQKQIAKEYGLPFEEWVERMRKLLAESEKRWEEIENAPPMTQDEIKARIKYLRENPDVVYVHRRITGDDTLTIEEMIANLEEELND